MTSLQPKVTRAWILTQMQNAFLTQSAQRTSSKPLRPLRLIIALSHHRAHRGFTERHRQPLRSLRLKNRRIKKKPPCPLCKTPFLRG